MTVSIFSIKYHAEYRMNQICFDDNQTSGIRSLEYNGPVIWIKYIQVPQIYNNHGFH